MKDQSIEDTRSDRNDTGTIFKAETQSTIRVDTHSTQSTTRSDPAVLFARNRAVVKDQKRTQEDKAYEPTDIALH